MGTKTLPCVQESTARAKQRREAQIRLGQQLGVQPPSPLSRPLELDAPSYRLLYLAVRDLLNHFQPHDCHLGLSLYSDVQFNEDFRPSLNADDSTELLSHLTAPWSLSQAQLDAVLYHLQPDTV